VKKALIVVDMQNDFMPTGSLPVKESDELTQLINQLMPRFDLVVASQDWHPADHGSFASQYPGKKPGETVILDGLEQILWPPHCIQETKGAEFVEGLEVKKISHVFHKGIHKNVDSYSAFYDNEHRHATGLGRFLKAQKVTDVYLVGVATDYCVKYSALDACALRLRTHVIIDACRGVELKQGDVERAIGEMNQAGARIVTHRHML